MHKLPKLPYTYDALEPYIDVETMKVHHGKHHRTYVDKLNDLLDTAFPDGAGQFVSTFHSARYAPNQQIQINGAAVQKPCKIKSVG